MVADHKAVGPFISLSVPQHRSPTSLFLSIAQDAPTRYPSFLCSGLSVELARLSGDAQWLWWNVQVKLTLSRLPIFLNRAVECDNGVCVQTIKRHYHTK